MRCALNLRRIYITTTKSADNNVFYCLQYCHKPKKKNSLTSPKNLIKLIACNNICFQYFTFYRRYIAKP